MSSVKQEQQQLHEKAQELHEGEALEVLVVYHDEQERQANGPRRVRQAAHRAAPFGGRKHPG
eukprot:9432380-Lingulodinium_polyedra.AAC.1